MTNWLIGLLIGFIALPFIVTLCLLYWYIRQVRTYRISRPIVEKLIARMAASLSFLTNIQVIQQTRGTVFVAKGSVVIFRCPTAGCNHWCDNLNYCPGCKHDTYFTADERNVILSIPHKFRELVALSEFLKNQYPDIQAW